MVLVLEQKQLHSKMPSVPTTARCSLEASKRVTNSMTLDCPLPLTVRTFYAVTTLKVSSCPLPLTVRTFYAVTTLKVSS
jgi:hypothetical protein